MTRPDPHALTPLSEVIRRREEQQRLTADTSREEGMRSFHAGCAAGRKVRSERAAARRALAIPMFAKCRPTAEIAEALGVSESAVQSWRKDWRNARRSA